MMFRVIDQVTAGVRRTLFFAHYVTAAYFALILYLSLVEGRAIEWGVEYGKIACLYVGSLYVAFSSRGPELRRRRAADAIRVARSLVQQLREKSRELLASKARTEAALDRQATLASDNAQLYEVAQQQRRQLTRIFDSTSDGILFVSADGRLEAANKRAGELLGFEPTTATGRQVQALIPDDGQAAGLGRVILSLLDRPMSPDHGYVDVPAARQILSWAARPLDAAGFTLTISDVTQSRDLIRELKRKSEQLEDSMRRAESASEAKSAFVANMSHEIRTPLTSILGLTQLTLDAEATPLQRERLHTVLASANSLLAILNDVLDFAKIEAGQLAVRKAPFSVRDTLDDVVMTFGVPAHEKGLELSAHVAADVPDALVGDHVRIRQVIVNLVANAIKFTDAGEVVVRVGAGTRAPEAVTLHVTVADTGAGVPAEKQRQIFEPFVQGDGSMARRHHGTGLGLSISTELVELMGGQLWLEDREGSGSTFHFTATFPLQTGVTAVEDATPALLDPLRGGGALVVDPHDVSRTVVVELLRGWGLVPSGVPGAAEATQALREASARGEPCRLVVIDAAIPGAEADEISQVLDALSPAPPVVLLQRSVDADRSRVATPSARVVTCCSKPVTRRRLLEAVRAACGLRDEAAGDYRPRTRHAQQAGPPRRVLIAEDTDTNRMLVEHLLQVRGHHVESVPTGPQALAAVARRVFDVVLMDLQMPDMDGFDCTAAIRTAEGAGSEPVRIVAMTAAALPGDRERCLDAGMDDYLSKPIDADALYAAIESVPIRSEPEREFQPSAFIERLGGDVDLAKRLSSVFLTEGPDVGDRLRAAIDATDPKGVATAAHALKGMLGNFGVPNAYAAVVQLEALGLEGDLATAEDAWRTLVGALDRLAPALHPLVIDPPETSSYRRH